MGPIQSVHITSATTTQVTTQRTKFLGCDLVRSASGVNTVAVRNGTSGSSTVLFTLTTSGGSARAKFILPSGTYILCEDGLHITTTGSQIVGITAIYQT